MTILRLNRILIPIFLAACFCSCGQVSPKLTGTYSCGHILDKDADSAFVEITKDSLLIFTSYHHLSDSFSITNVAIAKLQVSNDTLFARINKNDSLYCESVRQYAEDHSLFKGNDIGCFILQNVFLTDFASNDIKLTNKDEAGILRKLK